MCQGSVNHRGDWLKLGGVAPAGQQFRGLLVEGTGYEDSCWVRVITAKVTGNDPIPRHVG